MYLPLFQQEIPKGEIAGANIFVFSHILTIYKNVYFSIFYYYTFSICNVSKLTGKNAVFSLNSHSTINKVKNLFMITGYFFLVYYIFPLYTNFFFLWGH